MTFFLKSKIYDHYQYQFSSFIFEIEMNHFTVVHESKSIHGAISFKICYNFLLSVIKFKIT